YKVTVDKTNDTSTRLKVHDKPLSIIEQLHLVDATDDNNTVSENSPFELLIRYNKSVKNVVLNRDNKRVSIDKHTQIIYEDNSSSVRIRFDAAQPDDKGKYETIVKDSTVMNKDGLRSQSVTILVKPLPVLFTTDIQVSVSDQNNIPEKTELILTTTINQEKGKIKWFFNNKEIKDDQNHKIIVKNLQRQLIIKSTAIADSGIYNAKSDDDERTVELTITDDLRFTKDLMPSNINTMEGKENELVFECETSKSTTVQWFHDQQKLLPNELKKHYQMESLKNNTIHKLRILQPVAADSGLYRCVLPTNIETNSQCTIEPAGVDFLQHLTTPVHVEYMKSALLECELSRRPQNIVWKDKNGHAIEDSDKYEIMNNGKLQGLIINDCDENDNGQYTIIIDDTKSSTAEVIVEPSEEKVRSPSPKPEPEEPVQGGFRTLLPNQLKVDEDTDFILECEVNNPKQVTDWYLDDDLIQDNSPRFKIITEGTKRKLKVLKAELDDTGNYTCKDRQNNETTNCDINVVKASIRIIKGLPETLIVSQGEQLKLDVELSHPNIPGCRFIKDDTNTPIRKDKRTRITADGTHYTLMIDSVLPMGDSGTYEFLGLNDSLRSTCNVTVKPLPSKITQPLKDVTLQENQNLSLEARIDNEHAPVVWFINGKEIPPGGDVPHVTIMSKGRRHTLVVQKVDAKLDAGQYEIRTPDDSSSCQVTIEETGTPPADFTKKLQNTEIAEFNTVELKCETNRDNLPVEWFKDSKLIESNEHYKLENNGKDHSLFVNDILMIDQGSYTCQIKSNGKATTATLKVKEMPADFVHKIEPIDAITGDTISFECELNKPNIKVKWLKDNKTLAINDRVQPSIDAENPHIHLLTLKILETKDAGTYTCVIDQPASKKCSAPLAVKTITVTLSEPLKDMSLIENENLILKFSLSHELKQIPVIWKLNNKPIEADNDRIQIEQDGKSHFLTIKQIKINEQGSYSVEIPTHKIKTSSQVNVKPEEIKILKDLHIVPNDEQPENLLLEIQLSKPSQTDIILLRNGVKPTRKIPVKNFNDGRYQFILENVIPDDSGLYEIPLRSDLKSSLQVNIEPKQKEDLDFSVPLKDKIEINETEPIYLEAKLNRKPDSSNDIVWLRNGKPIPPSIKTSINEDLSITLEIPQGNIENDTGKYTLKLPNGKQCSTQVNILRKLTKKDKNELVQPLHIILDENQIELKLNEKVTLRCKTSLPIKDVQWYKGSRKVSTRRANISSTENSTQHDLILSKLEIDDLGQYRVELDSDIESSIELNILQELSPIRCQGEPIEGQTITLICDTVLPPKQIKWSPIIDRKRFDQQDLLLKIKNLNVEQDSKVFTIDVDGQKQSYELIIQPLPMKFQGIIELNPKLPKEDDNVTCAVTLNKPLKDQVLDWYLNDQLIVPNDRFILSTDGLRSILTIKNIRPQDAGQLECRLPFSDEKLSTQLQVKEKSLAILKPLTADKDKPVQGDDVTLSCQFSKKPKTIEVYKDGKQMDFDQELNDLNATFKINLPKTKPNDKGKYTVIADGVETSYTLRLTPNPIKFLKQLKWDKESPYEGDTVQATFTLSRIPDKTIQWFKGKLALPTDSTPKYVYSQIDCTFTLTIPSVELTDADTYTVKLPDDTQSSARLKVLETPVKVLVPLTLQPAEPILGNEFTLSVTLSRDVKKNAKWIKAGKDLSMKPDSRISFKQEPDVDNQGVRYIMTIRDSKPEDEGTYRFEVESSKISEPKIVQLTEPKILIVQCDEKLSGKIGSSLTLTCELNFPQGHVVWYHDGIKLASSDSTPLKSTGLTLKNTNVTRTLTIISLKKDDFGSYTIKTKDDKRQLQVVESSSDDQLKVLEHPPKLLDLDQGNELSLSIVTNRKCSIEFSKNNQVLKTSENFDKDKSRYTVTFSISKVDFNDAGIYKSIIQGTKYEYQTEILVHDPYERQKTDVLEAELPLLFIKKLEDQKVKAGEQVILDCQLNRPPKTSPIWYRDGKEITSNDNIEIIQDDKLLQLKINKTSINDQAEYTLNIENLRGHAFIDLAEDRVRFTQKLFDTVVKVGTPIALECKLSIADTPITWKRDGQILNSGLCRIDGNLHTLRIPSAELDHSGIYSAHYNDEINTSCTVSVQTEPVFARELSPEVTLKVGSNILLDVETTRPNKTVQWYRNGKLIPRTGDTRHRLADDKYDHSLKLTKVTQQDDDETLFECECDNVRTTCRVYVQTEPLVFFKDLKDVKYELDDRITFIVRMNKRPSDNSRWLHNGQPIEPSNRLQLLYDDAEHEAKLIINNADENDQGKYIYDGVEARTSCTADLKLTKLEFIQELRNRSVKQDQPVQFEFEVNKIPTKVVWMLNGQVIENDGTTFDLTTSPGRKKYMLKIKQTQLSHAGTLTVRIDDQIESTATLEVKPIPIEFIKCLTGARVNENDKVNFICELNKPNIHVKWFLNEEPIANDEHFEIQSKGPVHTLVIHNVAWSEGGEYKCIADGGAKTSATLLVKTTPVTFTKPLEECTCNFGEPLEFICETSKPCRVDWFLGDKRLSSQQYEIQSIDNKHTLRIPKVKLSDKGWYKCAVQDIFTEAKLIVIDKPVELIEPLKDCSVQENENATLFCQLSKPDMDVIWYNNDRRIFFTSQSRIRAKQIDCYYKLLLDEVEYDDQGLYEMRCEHIKTSCHLTVKKLETTFLDHLKNLNVQEGDTARFQCRLSKIDSNVQWFKNGVRVSPSERTIYSIKGDLLTLTIHNAQIEDEGNYRCMVDNQHTDGTLTVEPSPTTFIKYLPKTWTVYGDEPLELSCQLSRPNVRVIWLKDGIPIDEKSQLKNEGSRYSLYIPHGVQPGRYTIRIDDIEGKESTCEVSVQDLTENERRKPRIIRGLDDLNIQEGETAEFSCQFEGEDVEATWFFDGIMLRTNVFITINFKPNELAQLIMKEAYFEDAGLYKLRLRNKYGEAFTTCVLSVRHREISTDQRKSSIEDLPPKFIGPLTDVYVHKGQEANFRAIITGQPSPKVTWYCNYQKIANNEKYRVTQDNDVYLLAVIHVDENDECEYSCKAENSAGEKTCSANLHLIETPAGSKAPPTEDIAPSFIRKHRNCTVIEGQRAKFDCFITGQPNPTIRWLHNGLPLDVDSNTRKYSSQLQANGKVTLTIEDCLQEDAGEITIIVENRAGSTQCSAELTVEPHHESSRLKRRVSFDVPELAPSTSKQGPIPSPPSRLLLTPHSKASLNLSWDHSPSHNRAQPCTYLVELRDPRTYSWSTYVSALSDTSVQLRDLNLNHIYAVRVRAENRFGVSDPSQPVTSRLLTRTDEQQVESEKEPTNKTRRPYTSMHDDYGGVRPSLQVDGPDIQYFLEGQNARITMLLVGYPIPEITWFHDGEKIPLDDPRVKLYNDRRGYAYLSIDSALASDEGTYEIVAENKYGTARRTVYLYLADPPMFLEPLQDTRCRTHDTFRLECKVDGIPYPEVRFYKDWRLLADSYRTRIRHIEPDIWQLTIYGAIEKDTGLYTCTAKNIAGATLSSANVSIEDNLLSIPRPDLERPTMTFKKKRFDEDYDILERIEHGPISSVYRVIERRTAKERIAKIVHNSKYFDWLRREMDILSHLHDSNIPRIHDAYETDKMLAIVLDNFYGNDLLENLLNRRTYTERDAALIIRDLVETLKHLHSRNIAHLDIKPDNIYIDNRHDPIRVQLLGFTNARHLTGSSNVYSDYGTPEYVAPEIVHRYPISLNTDMWNIGILTYLLLGGQTPFSGSNDFEILKNIRNGQWIFNDCFSNISADAKDFISRLLIPDQQNRLTSEDALNHSWLKYALQHVDTTPISSDRLQGAYSRQLYNREHRRTSVRPLPTISEIASMKGDFGGYNDEKETIYDDRYIRARARRTSREVSFDEHDHGTHRRPSSADDENLTPGSYLLPVADVDFAIRMRSYRRTSYQNRYTSSEYLYAPPVAPVERLLARDTVKERLHVDGQGRRVRGCSAVPHSGCSVPRELSVQPNGGTRGISTTSSFYAPYGRTSESPAHGYGISTRYGSTSRLSPYPSSTKHAPSIPREFQAQGFTQEQRGTRGEGFASVFKEKLIDTSFLIGGTIILRCKVQGNPFPRIFWYRNDEFIIEDDRIQFAQGEDGLCTLTITHCKASDIGIYRCVSRNLYGDASCKARLLIGDVPDRPQRPIVIDISSSEAYLVWSSPLYDGNNEINGFRIDYKAREDLKWTQSTFTIEESALIHGLKPSTYYRFRVSCINRMGISAYSWASEEIRSLDQDQQNDVLLTKIDRQSAYRLLEHQHRLDEKSRSTINNILENYNKQEKIKSLGEKTVLKRDLNPWDLYKLVDELSSYGRKCVIRCSERATDSVRIIKITDKQDKETDEFNLLNLISHEHIITMLDAFLWKNSFILVINDYIELPDWICLRHKYSEELIVKILRQIFDAIHYLHFHGIIHLNINPSSVVNENRLAVHIKLTDFSCAQQIASIEGHSIDKNNLQPTIEYSAPEILHNESCGVQADVWSIGALTATLLSGFSPFSGENIDETIQNVSFVRWNTNEFYDDVTQEAVIFVQQCLKKSPRNRLTIPACIDHKWLSLASGATNRRENAIFLTEKLRRFAHDFRQRCRAQTEIQQDTIIEISKR
ncbi:unnamed protein product, partial [Rotaria magnacalcarata]